MKIWRNIFSSLCLLAIAILTIVNLVEHTASEDCVVCGYIKCHAPCILNLATGEIDELQLYMPHDQIVGEIAAEQTGGTFAFMSAAGVYGTRHTDPWYIELEIPMVGNSKKTSNFCDKCLLLLEDYKYGFVLLDIFDLENPVVYRIEAGASYEMRCYKIGISLNSEDESYILRLNGTL